MSDIPIFVGLVTEDGQKLLLDYPAQFKAYYSRFKGDEVELTIKKRRSQRSLRQNAALHACLSQWAVSLRPMADVEQLKDDLLALRWGFIVRQSLLTGEIIRELVKPHTSQLSTAEFAELFDLAVIEAAKTGHVMELPDEFKERKAKEAKQRQKATRAA